MNMQVVAVVLEVLVLLLNLILEEMVDLLHLILLDLLVKVDLEVVI